MPDNRAVRRLRERLALPGTRTEKSQMTPVTINVEQRGPQVMVECRAVENQSTTEREKEEVAAIFEFIENRVAKSGGSGIFTRPADGG